MADFFGRRKLFDNIKCLFNTLPFHKGRVSSKALSICIRCKPDNLVCSNMLNVLCKRESSVEMIELALSIFHKIVLLIPFPEVT
ncbi:hypothetical protein JHK82_023572 [Glycine max]|nr:hypothetical protein JHK86_023630 [Glycine max]KAG5138841.1 hypothetical protein JHK82_023572 [Glycine max]